MASERAINGLPPESLAAIRTVFFQECEEHLAEIRNGLGTLQGGDRDPETIEPVFRAAHSIKGGAGIFGYDALVGFAHRFEAAMGEIRAGRLQPGPDVLGRLSAAAEGLADLIAAAREDRALAPARTGPLLESLGALTPAGAAPDDADELDFKPRPMDFQPLGATGRGRPRSADER